MRSISCLILRMLFLLVVLPLVLHAQQTVRQAEPVELSIDEIGVAQGLSQGMVHGLQVDLKGYLWIATKDGLNRYDGNHFQVFRHDPQDSNSIASNYVLQLHIDDRGLIWVGTNASGLDLYDPAKESFIHFGASEHATALSEIQSVTRIFSDPSGKMVIWDGTGKQCEMLSPMPGKDPFTREAWKIIKLENAFPEIKGLQDSAFHRMIGFAADGALLLLTQEKLLAVYSDHVQDLTLQDMQFPQFNDATSVADAPRYFLDNRRRLHAFSDRNKMVYTWDQAQGIFKPWIKLPEDLPLVSNRFFVDHQDRIWINGAEIPMWRVDPELGVFQQMQMTRYHFAGTSVTDIAILCEDHQHNLWVGTAGHGIIKISSRNDQFIHLSDQAQLKSGIRMVRDGFSFSIHDTLSKGMYTEWQAHLHSLNLAVISACAEDPLNRIWCIGLDEVRRENYFLLRMDFDGPSFFSTPIPFCDQIPFENEASLMFDRNGDCWMGAECVAGEARLIRQHLDDSTQTVFTFPVQVIHNEHPFISDWYVDEHNDFWIGTKQGLFVFTLSTAQWKYFHVDPARKDALSNNHILSICPDPAAPSQYLWIGTDGGGLNRMDIASATFKPYTTSDGLPNNVVYAVQSDQHHNLWLSTNLGLCRFDVANEKVWSFTIADGLPGNEFNRLEYGKTLDGHLAFGGVEGLTIFNPEVFYTSGSPSPIVINRLKLSNKEIFCSSPVNQTSGENYTLPAPLEQCTQLTFPYTQRMITLGFSLLDFTNPNGNQYRYKLDGFNADWIDAGDVNEAVFTNLNPGSYTFMVSGCNSNNTWSEAASLQLIILSPWWATWWFRSFIVLVIVACIYAFYRYRLQQAMKLQHLRNRIAADLHDEIGSTLSSISLAGTVIQHKLKNDHPEVGGLLDKINTSTQSMMEAMSDIVWAVNTKNDRFDQILHRMRAFAAEILEPKEVTVLFNVSAQVIPLQLDMEQRKNLYLLFKEVIHNAAKYAQCQNVWINLNYMHGRLRMEVRDDGVGFVVGHMKGARSIEVETSTSGQRMGGNGIQNMYQRAQELKGQLEIKSSQGQGTTFTLSFPV